MTNPVLLPAGQELFDWLRRGGRPDRASSFVWWLYSWRAVWLEFSYSALRKNSPPLSPNHQNGEGFVFVQGFWRSGTTLLHELLSEIPHCGAPRTWQCMDPSAMLVPRIRLRGNRTVQRPMDQISISTFSPQEDEFALMAMGVPSVYRGFLDPRRLPELVPLTNQAHWMQKERESWLRALDTFLAWCREPDNDHLIIKSPNHVFRTYALAAHFPKARFLWILRDPAAVWRSNLKMWQAMIERYSLWTAAKRELEDFLEAAFNAYADLLEEMQSNGSFLLQPAYSYELLTSYPSIVLPELLDSLGLGPWSELPIALQASLLAKPRTVADPREAPQDAPASVLNRLREIQDAILCVRQNTSDGK